MSASNVESIRVLHIVDNLGKGGLENGLANLIERMDPARFEHVVFAIRRLGLNADRLAKASVRVICAGKTGGDSAFQIPLMLRCIREVRPDIVHSRNWAGIEAVVAGRWFGPCALIHSEHGVDLDSGSTTHWRRRWLRRLAFELADRVMCVSYQLRDSHAKETGFSPGRITVIHNGVNTERYRPDAAQRTLVRKELGVDAEEVCIVSVGNLFPVKDHMTLLQAMAETIPSLPNLRLFLIGEGPELPKLQAFLDGRPEMKSRTRFLGITDKVPELLRGMDIYVSSSINEGISNSVLEAMATGLPVLATAAGGNPETVVNDISGLLFPVGDGRRLADLLLRLGTEQETRSRLGAGALCQVRERFTMESMVSKYDGLYSDVLTKTGRKRLLWKRR